MQILMQGQKKNLYSFLIFLDSTKVLNNGQPDPDYLLEVSYSMAIPDGTTQQEFLQMIQQEALLQAQTKLDSM